MIDFIVDQSRSHMPNNPKRNHHVLPKLYLKGFVIEKGKPGIWIYKRGEKYNPGRGKITNNPYEDSINQASVERDFYADPEKRSQEGYESCENKLELLEKPADRIFEKLRTLLSITAEEKRQFAIYIVMMHRRVHSGRETVRNLIRELPASYEPTEELFAKLNWPNTIEARAYVKQISKRLAQKQGFDVQAHAAIAATASESLMPAVLEKMTWHFFVAPPGETFLTGDSPVFISEKYGLGAKMSECSFPVSAEVSLVASWHKQLKEGFGPATPRVVKILNGRIASKAVRHLYGSIDQKWVVTLLGNVHEFRPIVNS